VSHSLVQLKENINLFQKADLVVKAHHQTISRKVHRLGFNIIKVTESFVENVYQRGRC